jgi:hypothetical protein
MAAHMVLHLVALRRGMELPPDEAARAMRMAPRAAVV